jgi:hypothetical protein
VFNQPQNLDLMFNVVMLSGDVLYALFACMILRMLREQYAVY